MSMSTVLNFGRDVQGLNAYSPTFPVDILNGKLATGVEQTFTITQSLPTSCTRWVLIFGVEPGTKIWIARNATAVAPTSTVAAASSLLNPTQLSVYTGDVIHLITDDTTAQFSVAIYAIP